MASGLTPVPVPSQKHDPAWKHCQMFKDGDKVQLKCVYCGKLFKGGGIHRIKEHLACQKGNASTCLRVPPDVRGSMQRSLDGVVAKKRNRQKLDEEITNITTPVVRTKPVQMSLVGLHECDVVEHGLGLGSVGRDERTGGGDRRKRGRGRASSLGRDRADLVDSGLGSKMDISSVQIAIGRFMYDIGAPLDAVDSPFFQPMIEAVASGGPGIVSPTCHDLRGWILKNSLQEVRGDVESYRGTWEKTGCSVLVDELNPEPDSCLLCFHVNCPEGTVFLKTVDASGVVGSSDALYKLLRGVVEEVGPTNVVQVVTSGNSGQYVLAGVKLGETFPNLYWAPCGLRLIDAILEDFGNIEWISEVIEQAQSITRFVYNHGEILNIVRRYTFCNEIVEPGFMRSAANFATLKRLVDLKHNLHTMVTSQEWVDCPRSKKPGGLDVMDLVSNESFWSSCGLVVNLTSPLLRALTIVSDENRPAVGYIYAAMYRTKETIKKELVKKEEYTAFWDIIDHRWEYLRNFPLLSAGFYLNPKFFYSVQGDIPNDISSGLFDCIERLVPDTNVQDKIIKEISLYKNAAGDFGRKMALRTKETLLPAEWWSAYGGGCPNLARLAVRILSQTCSVISCNKQDQGLVRKLHNTGNSIEHQRLSDLVFVHKNLRLKKMVGKRHGDDSVEEWVRRLEGDGDSDWTAIDPPPSATAMTLVPQGNEGFDDLGVGFEDIEIFSRVKDGEDEAVRDNVSLK